MEAIASKESLFKPRLAEEEIEVPGVGIVRIRALSRVEAIHVQEANGVEATERRVLALGMVEPALTEYEVGQWQRASAAGEIEVVSTRIAQLSGLVEGAPKEAVKSFEADPASEFRVLPSAETRDDGESSSPGNE